MTSILDLKKVSIKSGFTEKLKSLDFIMGPDSFWFYRIRGEYIDLIRFWVASSGNWVSIPINSLKLSLSDHSDMSVFPKGFSNDAPLLSSCFINEEYGVEIGSDDWKIKTEENVETLFKELFLLIEDNADQWFKAIDSDEKLYDSFSLNIKESLAGEEYAKRLFHTESMGSDSID